MARSLTLLASRDLDALFTFKLGGGQVRVSAYKQERQFLLVGLSYLRY